MLPALVLLAIMAGPAQPVEGAPSPPPPGEGPVILFLVDNSASLPPLDPQAERVAALEKMFSFLKGYRYRLVLFGGRNEVYVDDVSRYRNDGQWTDFYSAFLKARGLQLGYPAGTELRIVLVTDAIVDPDPKDWPDLPPGWDVRSHSMRKTVELVGEMKLPLYVMLIGDPAGEVTGQDREQSPGFVLDLVRAANGAAAAPLAQTVAAFFKDDGVLLRKFVYRVPPAEGLARIEPVVKRIAAAPRAGIELRIFGYFVLPLLLILIALLGLLVRSFPGPGDLEVLELAADHPLHLVTDRIHRSPDGTWSTQGLCLVEDPRTAAATVALLSSEPELTGRRARHERARSPRPGAAACRPRRRAAVARGRGRLGLARGQDPRAEPRLRGARPRPARGRARARVVCRGARADPGARLRAGESPPGAPRGAAQAAGRAPRPAHGLRQGRHAPRARRGRAAADRTLRLPGA